MESGGNKAAARPSPSRSAETGCCAECDRPVAAATICFQQAGIPAADSAPVTGGTLTPVPVTVTPPPPPPLPYDVTAHRFGGGSPASVPLPKQSLFSGTGFWEGFIRPFSSLAQTCRWREEEKLFRLSSSLRGDAAEYAFCQLTPDVVGSYDSLVCTLEATFQDCDPVASYLAQLGVPSS